MTDPLPTRDLGPVLEFLQLLWQVNHGMERRSRRMQDVLGVTGPQRMVVRLVGRYPGITAGDLAALLRVDRGTLSAAVARLEASGIVRRASDPADRRRVRLHLTARGKLLDREAEGTIESAVAQVMAAESPRSVATARRVLDALSVALATDEGQGTP